MRKKLLGLLIIGFIGLNCISTIIAVTADAQTTSGTLSPGDYSYVDVGVNAGDVVRVNGYIRLSRYCLALHFQRI